MTTPRFHPAAAAVALLLATVPPAAAQAIAYGEPPPIPIRPPALAERYQIRLTSAWPQLPGAAGCESGGRETVVGTLTRTAGGEYAGSFSRTTHLLFCGTHGGQRAEGDACSLVLDGEGEVAMRGTVVAGERSPSGRSLQVTWAPDGEHTVRVAGACPAAFKESVERMYRSVRHGAEFALPNAGAAPRTERLEDYGWEVEVR
ncbi:MAG TPA: hypothetical protein VMN37_01605 [Gemmatimonadales bacterium]|nr:hypothetical protein [Gemmatimonadales bacterium]